MRREHVVVVGKGQILPRCELRGLVRIGGNALVLDFGVDDALVLRGAGADCLAHVGVAPSLASTRTSCQFGAVWACTLSKNCCKNCGGVLYSGVRMLMVGQPSARAAASARWVSSVCFDGRYRAFLPKNRRLKKPTARPAMTPTPVLSSESAHSRTVL